MPQFDLWPVFVNFQNTYDAFSHILKFLYDIIFPGIPKKKDIVSVVRIPTVKQTTAWKSMIDWFIIFLSFC